MQTDCRFNDRVSIVSRIGIFLFVTSVQTGCETILSPIQWVIKALYLWLKLQEREADSLLSCIVEVNKSWNYPSVLPLSFMMSDDIALPHTHTHAEGLCVRFEDQCRVRHPKSVTKYV
jgi:hypothetical protein